MYIGFVAMILPNFLYAYYIIFLIWEILYT